MSFSQYLFRRLAGLPGIVPEDVIRAVNYDTSPSPAIAKTLMTDSKYDLHKRQLDLHMFGAISPQPQSEDLLSSNDLHNAAIKVLQDLHVGRSGLDHNSGQRRALPNRRSRL